MKKEEIKKQIGSNIIYCRKQKGIKQIDLAIGINKSVSYLCDIERGRTMPSLKVLFEIVEKLEINVSELFKNI